MSTQYGHEGENPVEAKKSGRGKTSQVEIKFNAKLVQSINRYVDSKVAEATERLIGKCVNADDNRLKNIHDNTFTGNINSDAVIAKDSQLDKATINSLACSGASVKLLEVDKFVGSVNASAVVSTLAQHKKVKSDLSTTDELIVRESADVASVQAGEIETGDMKAKNASVECLEVKDLYCPKINGMSVDGEINQLKQDVEFKREQINSLRAKQEKTDKLLAESEHTVGMLAVALREVSNLLSSTRAELVEVRKIAEAKPEVLEQKIVKEKTHIVTNNFEVSEREFKDIEAMRSSGKPSLCLDKAGRLVYTCSKGIHIIKGERV